MSKDTKFVFGIVSLALLCSSIPIITLFVMGAEGRNGTLSDRFPGQLDQPILFMSMVFVKLASGSLFIPIIGLALSLYYRYQNPKKFQLMSLAFTIFLVGALFIPVLTTWLEIDYAQQGVPPNQMAAGYSIVNCVSSFVYITAWIILLFAIFSHKFNTDHAAPET